MKDLNKKTEFDQQWADVFSDAEKAPPDGIWNKIDSELSRNEAGYFKRKAFVFKLLAAASIAFAMGIGAFSLNYYLGENSSQLVIQEGEKELKSNDMDISPIIADSAIDDEKIINSSESDEMKTSSKNIEVNKELNSNDKSTEKTYLVRADNPEMETADFGTDVSLLLLSAQEKNTQVVDVSMDQREIYTLDRLLAQGIDPNSSDEMVFEIDHIYLIPIMPRGSSKVKKDRENGGFLAGLDFSTGLFDPNFKQGNSVFASAAGSTYADARVESVNNQLASFDTSNKDFLLVRSAGQETEPDISYSYGANFGFKVSRRVILQTGISYRKANTTTTTTGYLEDAGGNYQIPIVAAYQYQLNGLSSVQRISETNLSNQYEFASIPLRAGYVLLDKKFNLTFLAGVSSELFLNNEIESSNGEFQTLTSSSGDGSPYRNVYFNGSLGTMLGYSFARNYLITVEPSYRFAMNSFTKDDFYLNSYPSSFMVSFGVAYNFK